MNTIVLMIRIWPDETWWYLEDLPSEEIAWLSDDYMDVDALTSPFISDSLRNEILKEL